MNYSLSQKPKRPGHPEQGKVWIATPQCKETVDTEELIKMISTENPFMSAQLNADFVLIVRYIRRLLRDGKNVNIKGLGTFYAKFDCEPLEGETAKGYNPYRQIKNVKAAWKPANDMKSISNALYPGEPEITFKEVPTLKNSQILKKANELALTSVDIR